MLLSCFNEQFRWIVQVCALSAEGRLRQDPAEELAALQVGEPWQASGLQIQTSQSVPIECPDSQAVLIELTLQRGQSRAAGVLLRAWLRAGQEGRPCAAALLVDWEMSTLQVSSHHLDFATHSA